MSRHYIFADDLGLMSHLDAHRLEVEHVLRTGILQRCNSIGTASYREEDIEEANILIHEAREKGQPLGHDFKEPAKATKQPADEPEGEVEALVDALSD